MVKDGEERTDQYDENKVKHVRVVRYENRQSIDQIAQYDCGVGIGFGEEGRNTGEDKDDRNDCQRKRKGGRHRFSAMEAVLCSIYALVGFEFGDMKGARADQAALLFYAATVG